MNDLMIKLDKTDKLPLIGEALGRAGINIEGLCVFPSESKSIVHLLVENAQAAKNVLESAQIPIHEVSDVYVFSKEEKQVVGKPGSFGEICRTLAENGISIIFGYPAENNRFVFGVDDPEKARKLLR